MAIGGDDAPAAILARVLAGDLAPTDTHPAIMRALQSDQVDLVTRQRALVAATHDCRRLIDSPAATASLIARIIAVAPDLSDPDAILRCLINLVTGYGMTEADIEPVVDAVASCLPGTAYGHIALRFIDVCVKADMITQGAVERVVVALCQAAAMSDSHEPWRIFRAILSGRHCARCGAILMRQLSQAAVTPAVRRGAIFFVGMAVWGSQRIDPDRLALPFLDVLDALLIVLTDRSVRADIAIIGEISASTRRLIRKFGTEITAVEWDAIIDILSIVAEHVDASVAVETAVRESLTAMRTCNVQSDSYFAMLERMHRLLDRDNLEILLHAIMAQIYPSNPVWFERLAQLMRLFFVDRSRPEALRLSAFSFAVQLFHRYQTLLADDILRGALLPYLSEPFTSDDSYDVQIVVIKSIGQIASSGYCGSVKDLVDVLGCAANIECIAAEVPRILEAIFRAKLQDPHFEDCLYTFSALLDLVNHCLPDVRQRVCEAIGKISCDSHGRVSMADSAHSRYLFISREIDDASASMVLHIERAWTALVNVLDAEADAQVFFAALDSVVLCCQDFNIVSLVDVDRLVSLLSDCLRAESLTLLAFIDRLSPVCLRAVITCLTVLLQNRYHLEDIAYSESVETCFHGLTICAMSCPALLVPHLSKVVAVLSSATSLSEAAVWATLECLYVFATFLDIIDSEALAVVAENTARVLSALIQILETVNARPAITHLAQRCTSLWFIKLDRHGRGVNYRALGTVLSNLAQRSSNACCLQDFMHRYSSTNDAPEFHMLTLPDRLEEITHRTLAQKIWAGDNAIVSVEILTSSTARVTVRRPASVNSTWIVHFSQGGSSFVPSSSVVDILQSSTNPWRSGQFCNEHLGSYEHSHHSGPSDRRHDAICPGTVLSCLPEFVIDQAGLLVHGQVVGDNLLTCLSVDETLEGSLSMLDQMPCQDTMKFGVIYVGYDQTNEVEILGNTSGSPLYERFLRSLGRFIPLRGSSCYSGGLDRTSDDDGCVALIWNDCLTRICFHVATLMPNYPEQFPHGENKKRHIGNDYVNIVYSDNCDAVYEINTIPSQLNFVNIVVRPVGNLFFRIDLIMKNDVLKSGFTRYCRFAPFATLAATVRHLALHAQITCCNLQAKRSGSDCVSNWQSRLQQIQRIKERHTI
ncbi:Rap-GAP domain-containing protein [Plasmodiophora brassicae]